MVANANGTSEVGQELADGRYRVVSRLGDGSMGQVYRAHDRRLNTDVVIKFPVASQAALNNPELLTRFQQEIRSLVELSHPHIVRIVDVGQSDGLPYVVMQYLAGGSLKSRLESGPDHRAQPMAPAALRGWVPAIARAIDFLHAEEHVHRDVKPANILFDKHGNAFLADFGLIKAVSGGSRMDNSRLTAAGYVLGTPNYLAPEVVMGEDFTPRADQYALAMTVHEALVGHNVMEGPTASATMVNQTKLKPPPPCEMVPGVPEALSRAVLKGLEKKPENRYDDCASLAKAVLGAMATSSSAARPGSSGAISTASPGGSGELPSCPKCSAKLPIQAKHVGKTGRCSKCGSGGIVELNSKGNVRFRVTSDSGSAERRAVQSEEEPRGTTLLPKPMETLAVRKLPARAPEPAAKPARASGSSSSKNQKTKRKESANRPSLTQLLGALSVVSLLGTLYFFFYGGKPKETLLGAPANTRVVQTTDTDFDDATPPASAAAGVASAAGPVKLNIAFGTEKENWLLGAVDAFAQTESGRGVEITLVGLGSAEGAQAVLSGTSATPVHIWSPASSAYRSVFEQEWKLKFGNTPPIARSENLAYTPMVLVMWKERYEAFIKRYGALNLETISQAMLEPGGWDAIAGKPEWGPFKFTHTDPETSNSGMLGLVLTAYAGADKVSGLTVEDVTQAGYQNWLASFERSLTRPGGAGPLSHSTGTQMKEMVLRGPSQIDCLLVYENLAIDYLRDAERRWGELRVVYPDPGMWNENPFYILDVPWSDERQRAAAGAFLDFLMSEPMQRRALELGFRPGNTSVGVRVPGSPLISNERYGVSVEVPRMCEPPRADVLSSLLTTFRRLPR